MKLQEILSLATAEDEAPLRFWNLDGALVCSWKSGHDAWLHRSGDEWSDFDDTWRLMERGDEITEDEANKMMAEALGAR